VTGLFCQHFRLKGNCEDCNFIAAYNAAPNAVAPIPHPPGIYQPVIAEQDMRVRDNDSDIERYTFVAKGTAIPPGLTPDAPLPGTRRRKASDAGDVPTIR
jgi:hypothetical protein